MCCNYPKIWTTWLYRWVMRLKNTDRIANRVDADQTAPLGSGSALFAQIYESENLGTIRYELLHLPSKTGP